MMGMWMRMRIMMMGMTIMIGMNIITNLIIRITMRTVITTSSCVGT